MLEHRREGDTVVVWKLDAVTRREIAESVIAGRKSGAEMARLYRIGQPTLSRIVAPHRITQP